MELSTILSIGSLLIALLSLFFSFRNYLNSNRSIIVDIDPDVYVLDTTKHLQACNNFEFSNLLPSKAIFLTIKLVNYSTSNKSFLDLRAFDPKTNANHFIATQRSMPFVGDAYVFISPFGDDGIDHFFIRLPERNYGPVPAGSCVSVDVLVFLNDAVSIEDGVMISIKTSEPMLLGSNPWSDTKRNKFKAHNKLFHIKDAALFQKAVDDCAKSKANSK